MSEVHESSLSSCRCTAVRRAEAPERIQLAVGQPIVSDTQPLEIGQHSFAPGLSLLYVRTVLKAGQLISSGATRVLWFLGHHPFISTYMRNC